MHAIPQGSTSTRIRALGAGVAAMATLVVAALLMVAVAAELRGVITPQAPTYSWAAVEALRNGVSTKTCPPNALTKKLDRDGFGAQFAATISVYAYAFITNRPFCFTPFDAKRHTHAGVNLTRMFDFIGGPLYGQLPCVGG